MSSVFLLDWFVDKPFKFNHSVCIFLNLLPYTKVWVNGPSVPIITFYLKVMWKLYINI